MASFRWLSLSLFVLLNTCTLSATGYSAPLQRNQTAANRQSSIVTNGNFAEWDDDQPTGWRVADGAGDGSAPFSIVAKGSGGGLELSGNTKTRTWKFMSQAVSTAPEATYELNLTTKAQGINQEPGQFNNCYVGVVSKNAKGATVLQSLLNVATIEWSTQTLYFRVPESATETEVRIFLSKTGTLSIKHIEVIPSTKSSFDILVDDMSRHYSYFQHKNIDWTSLTTSYREKAKTTDGGKFTSVITEMLSQLKDSHVWIIHDGKHVSTFQKKPNLNLNFNYVSSKLKDKKQIRGCCVTGKTPEGFGYILIESMSRIDDRKFRQIATDLRRLFDCPGLIVDFRVNGGGNEIIGQKIAGMFCQREYVYALRKSRSGKAHTDFTPSQKSVLRPWRLNEGDKAYTDPIICLQGEGAISSGEGFTLMMKAIPHCTNIGQPTRGASGNPMPIKLPNGVDVFYSRWVAMDAKGQTIEDIGVPPDVAIEHLPDGDNTFDTAIKMLNDQTKK